MSSSLPDSFSRGQRNFHGPAWRSHAAQHSIDLRRLCRDQPWDTLTLEAAAYYAQRSGNKQAQARAAEHSRVAAACSLQNDTCKTDVIKLMTLVDAPVAEIANQVDLDVESVTTWEQLFFDIRPLSTALEWVSVQVIEAEYKAGNSALAARMQLAATAGAIAVQALLEMDAGLPLDAAERLFQRKLQLSLKFDQALKLSIENDRNRVQFIRLHSELHIAEQRLNFASQKLAAQCTRAREAHELAKLRLNLRADRAQRKSQASAPQGLRRRSGNVDSVDSPPSAGEPRAEMQPAVMSPATPSPLTKLVWNKSEPKSVKRSKPKPAATVEATFRPPTRHHRKLAQTVCPSRCAEASPKVSAGAA